MDTQIDFGIPLGSQEINFSPTEFENVVESLQDDYMGTVQCADVMAITPNETIQICEYLHSDETIEVYDIPKVEDPIQVEPYTPTMRSPDDEGHYHVSMEHEQLGLNPSQPGPPDQTPFPGQYNFTVELCTTPSNNKCLLSTKLNKIYVDMGSDIPFQFKWTETGLGVMYVRACTVFVDKEHAEKRVQCCLQHRPPNLPEHIAQNVLHSSRERGAPGVLYAGRAARADHWYSVLVRYHDAPQRTHAYRFICKNSCSSGINRRAIGIVFTLEDASGRVHGRHVVNARVCSCPPRDRRKDEGDTCARGKRRLLAPLPAPPAPHPAHPAHAPRSKKVKLEPLEPLDQGADDAVFVLPQVEVVGADTVVAGLEMMAHMMRARRDPRPARAAAALARLQEHIHAFKAAHALP